LLEFSVQTAGAWEGLHLGVKYFAKC